MTTTDTRQNSMTAVCEAFGVPPEDWPLFARWAPDPRRPKTG